MSIFLAFAKAHLTTLAEWFGWILTFLLNALGAIYQGHKNESVLAVLLLLAMLGSRSGVQRVVILLAVATSVYTGYKLAGAAR